MSQDGSGRREGTDANMALDDVVYVGRTVLVQLEMVSRTFLCAIKIELGSARRARGGEWGVPKIMTATSTEQRTPSS